MAAVVIGAADQDFFPRLRMSRRKTMPIREGIDLFRCQLVEKSLGQIAQKSVAQTVDALEMFEQKDELLEMRVLRVCRSRCTADARRRARFAHAEDSFADRKCSHERF